MWKPVAIQKAAVLKAAIDSLKNADTAPLPQACAITQTVRRALSPLAGCGKVSAALHSVERGKLLNAVVYLRQALAETEKAIS